MRIARILPSLATLLPLAVSSTGANAAWNPVPLPLESALARSAALCPRQPSRVYLGMTSMGVMRSDDRGLTWNRASNGISLDTSIDALAVSATDPDHAWAGARSFVWRTSDSGASWLPSELLHGSVADLLFRPAEPSVLLAAVTGLTLPGVYRSTDDGATWSRVANLGRCWELAANPVDPNVVLAASQGGIIRTTDSGTTWGYSFVGGVSLVEACPSDPSSFYATDGNSLSRSTDAGASFAPVGGFYGPFDALAVDPFNSSHLLGASTGYGCDPWRNLSFVAQTTDGGAAWSYTFADPSCASNPTELLFDPQDASHAYLAQTSYNGGGFHHSSSGGAGDWTTRVHGIANFRVDEVLSDLASRHWARHGTAIYRSDGDLASWVSLAAGDFSDLGARMAVALGSGRLFVGGEGLHGDLWFNYFVHSDDGGDTWWPDWTAPPGLPASCPPRSIHVDGGAGNFVYVTGCGLQLSTNGGDQFASTGDTPDFTSTLAVDPVNPWRIFASGEDTPVSLSTDGGATYAPKTSGLPPPFPGSARVIALFLDDSHPVNIEAVYTDGAVYSTTDGGENWGPRWFIDTSGRPIMAATWDPATGHVFLATNGAGVVSSHPRYEPAGLPTGYVSDIHYDSVHATLLVATDYAGLWKQKIPLAHLDQREQSFDQDHPVSVAPNPTEGATTVGFDVPPGGAQVAIDIYDVAGRRVSGSRAIAYPAGRHTWRWDAAGSRPAAGVYFVRITVGGHLTTSKIVRMN